MTAESLVASLIVDHDPSKDGKSGGNKEIPQYRDIIAGRLMWLSVVTRPDEGPVYVRSPQSQPQSLALKGFPANRHVIEGN